MRSTGILVRGAAALALATVLLGSPSVRAQAPSHYKVAAEALFEELLEGELVKLGPDHPNTLATRRELAELYRRDRKKYPRAEKMLKDGGDKVAASDKSDVETALADAKSTLTGDPGKTEMDAARERLTTASHKLAEALYKANAAAGSAPTDGAPPSSSRASSGSFGRSSGTRSIATLRSTRASRTPNASTSPRDSRR